MISYLTGSVKQKFSTFITLLVGGVGYKVSVPTDVITSKTLNESIELYIHTHVKEDALDLYGFTSIEDLAIFELLLGVSGVGPKTAINIFGNGKSTKIKEAIVKGDVSFFTSVPRLGTKNAQKIIIELRSKLGSLEKLDLANESGETKEISDALRSFGFSSDEVKEAVKYVNSLDGTVSEKIKQGLKYLGRK